MRTHTPMNIKREVLTMTIYDMTHRRADDIAHILNEAARDLFAALPVSDRPRTIAELHGDLMRNRQRATEYARRLHDIADARNVGEFRARFAEIMELIRIPGLVTFGTEAERIRSAAAWCIVEGREATQGGNYIFETPGVFGAWSLANIEEVREKFAECLYQDESVADVYITADEIDIDFYTDFCPNVDEYVDEWDEE